MKIHEYQAKEILKQFGIPVPHGGVAQTPGGAREIARQIGAGKTMVKAQIHAGGRGKVGGIKDASSPEEVETAAEEMIGMRLVTAQTGPEGRQVRKVLVEEGVEVERELYLGVVVDRARACPVMMVSAEGGMEVERVASETPGKVIMEHVDPSVGLRPFQIAQLAFGLGLDAVVVAKARDVFGGLYRAFYETDCSLAEINPLVLTPGGELVALDAKINVDDSALYRHGDVSEMRDLHEEDPLEVEASRYNLNYIKLNGSVGCMVNGAGLAMATMDLVKLAGAEPANFLDVGGTATVETVRNGFEIILSDKNVRAVLINIFGGVMRCDTIAKGVIEASGEMELTIPVIIRLEGTNVEEARRLLDESDLDLIAATDLRDAARRVREVLERVSS
ncbi:MAG: ADP-forming succinate--CoA ligase subunit beta [Deltaproteobacteria bacterium]|nr:ADP-forming succinate--CoA ligase subunit beta [Deltaproteobacteria bacterium]